MGVGALRTCFDPRRAGVLSDQAFWLLLIPGLACAGALILASSIAARRAGALPPALVTECFVIAPLLLSAPPWVPGSSCQRTLWDADHGVA
jgi:hypothetical protein